VRHESEQIGDGSSDRPMVRRVLAEISLFLLKQVELSSRDKVVSMRRRCFNLEGHRLPHLCKWPVRCGPLASYSWVQSMAHSCLYRRPNVRVDIAT